MVGSAQSEELRILPYYSTWMSFQYLYLAIVYPAGSRNFTCSYYIKTQ